MVRVEVLKLVIKAKEARANNDLKTAWKAWCDIHDIYEDLKDMHEYHKAMELFSNNEVYDITDYGKKINGYV